jgi:hypothetical protein
MFGTKTIDGEATISLSTAPKRIFLADFSYRKMWQELRHGRRARTPKRRCRRRTTGRTRITRATHGWRLRRGAEACAIALRLVREAVDLYLPEIDRS